MKKLNLIILFSVLINLSRAEDINILSAGAKTDGKTVNTKVIQNAIDKISVSGGGTVIIPPGNFLTGSIVLKTGVTLHVQKGATLLGSKNLEDYLSIQPDFIALRTGQATKQLIFAEGQNNIGITGEGTIDGQGAAFERVETGDEPGITRPHLIQLIDCKNVRINDINMRNSGGWMQHYLACENLEIKGINVYNHCNYNNDGIDIDGCTDVVVSECFVDSDDDGICLKSTSPRSCKNVLVTNCVVKSHCNALKLGTETTGGFENIIFSNCTVSPSVDPDPIYGTLRGQSAISVEMVDGGLLDQVNINNIIILETGCPIFVRLGNRARKYSHDAKEPGIGTLRNVSISNVTATTSSKTTSNITGFPGNYAENINLSNIFITNLSDGSEKEAALEVRENDKGYPTAGMFGDILPASGFFVRHVKNITFNNVQLFLKGDNVRPAFILNDVKDAQILYPGIFSWREEAAKIVKDSDCENINVIN
ncbi:glycoside hydrolase [Maribellus comscasis]|uniref:Glycoside hydrolase n=1 Tax=Maribellus comscasis TaxID=2681766 RepID=A0A6I6K192_9BACT|nr:glycosyl hydrolase family 28 protein [Maribellus comscasis]QGY45203.1 glycoside hydrolase [Maribellus comscasis]